MWNNIYITFYNLTNTYRSPHMALIMLVALNNKTIHTNFHEQQGRDCDSHRFATEVWKYVVAEIYRLDNFTKLNYELTYTLIYREIHLWRHDNYKTRRLHISYDIYEDSSNVFQTVPRFIYFAQNWVDDIF